MENSKQREKGEGEGEVRPYQLLEAGTPSPGKGNSQKSQMDKGNWVRPGLALPQREQLSALSPVSGHATMAQSLANCPLEHRGPASSAAHEAHLQCG